MREINICNEEKLIFFSLPNALGMYIGANISKYTDNPPKKHWGGGGGG